MLASWLPLYLTIEKDILIEWLKNKTPNPLNGSGVFYCFFLFNATSGFGSAGFYQLPACWIAVWLTAAGLLFVLQAAVSPTADVQVALRSF